jgi:Putative metal-binding motif/WD40-like Beta Propeller Repeat
VTRRRADQHRARTGSTARVLARRSRAPVSAFARARSRWSTLVAVACARDQSSAAVFVLRFRTPSPVLASLHVALAVLSVLMFAGCEAREIELTDHHRPGSDRHNGSGDPIAGLTALRITPTSDETTFDGDTLDHAPVFRAIGKFKSSADRDVTSQVEWTLSRPEVGAIAGGKFESAAIGGFAEVRARAGDITGTAELRIHLEILIRSEDIDASVVRRFESASTRTSSAALALIYPPADATVPSNFANLHTQWHAPTELDFFELRIDSAYAHLRYYTASRDWFDDAESSRYFAPSHPGESLELRVSAISSTDPDTVVESPSIPIHVSQSPVPGAIYYASTTARGLKLSELSASSAVRVLPSATEERNACASCHAISRNGDRIALSTRDQKLAVYNLPDLSSLPWNVQPPGMPAPPAMPSAPTMPAGMPTDKGMMMMPPAMPPMAAMPPKLPPQDYAWGSFNPDGTQLAYAAKGKLRVIDLQTGMETKKIMLGKDVAVTQPDWSPDGRAIAVAYTETKPAKNDKLVRGSSIAILRVLDDGSLEQPTPVVRSSGPDDTLMFPAFSPDGRFIAYARATGGSKDNLTAQLFIVAADGSSSPVALDRANRLDALVTGNTMPTWAPATEAGPAFLAFSSVRDYGDVLAGTLRDQLWLTALDLGALDRGEDPSSPAVWLPFQDPSESNHRALWAATACAARPEVCDGRDDDCDSKVDESCCAPKPESCSDTADNDCDGVANEGCGCAETEVCDNGADDDCDTVVDELCKE